MPRYRFAEFDLDLEAMRLCRHGDPVKLERRPLDLLVLLVGNHGRLVTREEIVAALWPARVIIDFDAGVHTLVRKVRHVLGDCPDAPRFIETVPGRGYRFIAPVVDLAVPAPRVAASRIAFGGRPLIAVLGLLAATAAAWVALQPGPLPAAPLRIAVLPFENLTGQQELTYLASGLAEDTSMSLAQIDLPDVAVIGGVSARALARSAAPLPVIGREFDIDFVVRSSLRLDGRQIRVSSELVRVEDSEQVWSASFDRELTNVLGLQRELSIAIAEQVRQRLSPDVAAAIDRRQTQNPEAYALYLKGRYAWTRFLPTSVPEAFRLYEQAVATDPEYGLAWAGMAHALATSPMTADARPATVRAAARHALEQALAHGEDLAETQLALAAFRFFLDWDLPGAEAAAREAVALDPNSAMAHMMLGIALSQTGRYAEALAMMRRARAVDPLFPLMHANSAVVALQAEDPKSAMEFATQAIAINPEFWVGYLHLGTARMMLGDDAGALQAYTEAERMSGGNSKPVTYRAHSLAQLGRVVEARALLEKLVAESGERWVPPYGIAVILAGLDEPEQAFAWLERAADERDVHVLWLAMDPCFAALREDPRFAALLQRNGLVAGLSAYEELPGHVSPGTRYAGRNQP